MNCGFHSNPPTNELLKQQCNVYLNITCNMTIPQVSFDVCLVTKSSTTLAYYIVTVTKQA